MLSASLIACLALFASSSATPVAVGPADRSVLNSRANGPVSGGDFPTGEFQPLMDPMKNTSLAPYPTYRAISNFDYASLNLALHQEYIELDLFNYGIATFSEAEFAEAGLSTQDIALLRFMAQQEVGHATLLTNILGPGAAKQCTYNYTGAFTDVRSYIDFNQKLTRFGESGVIGFLSSLNSRDSANLLHASISTESRQQMVFRQFSGSAAMPVYFEAGIPQNWAWTLLAPYIQSCPTDNPRIQWSNFPGLKIAGSNNDNSLAYEGSQAAIHTNRTALVAPGDKFTLTWENPGKAVGPNKSYITRRARGDAKYAIVVSQLNATYIPLENISGNSATMTLPKNLPVLNTEPVVPGTEAIGALNGTAFVAVVADNPFLTAFNLSMIADYMVAGPALFQAS